jgi:hypothetical protein
MARKESFVPDGLIMQPAVAQIPWRTNIACFNSGHRIEDHFVDITDMIEIGKDDQGEFEGAGV